MFSSTIGSKRRRRDDDLSDDDLEDTVLTQSNSSGFVHTRSRSRKRRESSIQLRSRSNSVASSPIREMVPEYVVNVFSLY